MALYRGIPTLGAELSGWRAGLRYIAGLDEVGRGPMAGPVVAAALVLDPETPAPWWSDLRDSKALTAPRRAELSDRLRATAVYGVGSASHSEIDTLGLVPATRQAMLRALAVLPLAGGVTANAANTAISGGAANTPARARTIAGEWDRARAPQAREGARS